jgi:hypothetical protein
LLASARNLLLGYFHSDMFAYSLPAFISKNICGLAWVTVRSVDIGA